MYESFVLLPTHFYVFCVSSTKRRDDVTAGKLAPLEGTLATRTAGQDRPSTF